MREFSQFDKAFIKELLKEDQDKFVSLGDIIGKLLPEGCAIREIRKGRFAELFADVDLFYSNEPTPNLKRSVVTVVVQTARLLKYLIENDYLIPESNLDSKEGQIFIQHPDFKEEESKSEIMVMHSWDKELIKILRNKYLAANELTILKERGFRSYNQYSDHKARKVGVIGIVVAGLSLMLSVLTLFRNQAIDIDKGAIDYLIEKTEVFVKPDIELSPLDKRMNSDYSSELDTSKIVDGLSDTFNISKTHFTDNPKEN